VLTRILHERPHTYLRRLGSRAPFRVVRDRGSAHCAERVGHGSGTPWTCDAWPQWRLSVASRARSPQGWVYGGPERRPRDEAPPTTTCRSVHEECGLARRPYESQGSDDGTLRMTRPQDTWRPAATRATLERRATMLAQ